MFFNYKDIPVFYEETGDSSKSVIILHGWGRSHDDFASLTELLSSKYRVFSLDLPGFGQSREPDSVWGTNDYAELIENFIKAKRLDAVSLIGHSFGGRVSILVSSRNPIEKVLLIDSAGITPRRSLKYYYKVYTYKCIKNLLKCLPEPHATKLLNRYRGKVGSSDYNQASNLMRAILSKVVNEDLKSVMPSIKASTLLFWGEEDTATPLSDARYMESHIKDSGLVALKGLGHFSFMQDPYTFSAVVKSFFNID